MAEGFVKTDHAVEHLITRQNTVMIILWESTAHKHLNGYLVLVI